MLWKAVCAAVVLAFSFGLAAAEEYFGAIKKVENGKITYFAFKKGEKKGEEKNFSVAKSVKVVMAKFNKEAKKLEAGEEIEGGLKNKRFQEIAKGIPAQVITNDDGLVTEIRLFDFKAKKKDK